MTTTLVRVVKAEYIREYKIRLYFTDGVAGIVDFSRWLDGEVFRPLAARREFKRFFISGGTICWPNGADIAPETLRIEAEAASNAA